MVRTGVRPPLPRARRRACEPASNRPATVRPAAILLRRLAQMLRQQSPAIGALVRRRTSAATARQQYQCARFPLLRLPAMGSRRTPEPGALLARYDAEHRAKRK